MGISRGDRPQLAKRPRNPATRLPDDRVGIAEAFPSGCRGVASACRQRGLGHLAEDAAQEAFLRLLEKPSRFDRDRGSLQTYVTVTGVGRAIDEARAVASRHRRERADPTGSAPSPTDPAAEVVRMSTSAIVRDALQALPMGQRVPIELAFYGQLTYREVAAVLEQPEGTIKHRIRTGLRALGEALGTAGLTATG